MSLDYIPEGSIPASSSSSIQATGNVAPPKAKPAAGASTSEVMADVHQRFDHVDSGEVEGLDSTQEGNQVTQF